MNGVRICPCEAGLSEWHVIQGEDASNCAQKFVYNTHLHQAK